MNDKQLLIRLKTETQRQTSDDFTDDAKRVIENIKLLINQPVNQSSEKDLQCRIAIIWVSLIFDVNNIVVDCISIDVALL